MAWKLPIRCLSRGYRQGRLFVFIFHRVLARPDSLLPGEPDVAQFDWIVRFISKCFNVLPFGDAVRRLRDHQLPPASASITFDDGYEDNYTLAQPILRQRGVVGTFFVASAFLDGGRMWNDDIIEAIRIWPGDLADLTQYGLELYDLSNLTSKRRSLDLILRKLKYLPHDHRTSLAREIARQSGVSDHSDLMMNHQTLRALAAAGMEVGAHTQTHPILRELDDARAHGEILGGKLQLESILDREVTVFAYPNGAPDRDFDTRHVEMVRRAGFIGAATTARGVARADADAFVIPRFTPWDRTPLRFASRCVLELARSN